MREYGPILLRKKNKGNEETKRREVTKKTEEKKNNDNYDNDKTKPIGEQIETRKKKHKHARLPTNGVTERQNCALSKWVHTHGRKEAGNGEYKTTTKGRKLGTKKDDNTVQTL